jgi:hypothetical protein
VKEWLLPDRSLELCSFARIRLVFILNCTKNTELTRARFTRTFAIALAAKTARSGAATQRSSNVRQQQERQALGQRAMKSEQWKTYRTRFLVKAKQLSSGLSFIDHLGRQHCGGKGDYLVESCDGVISIAPKQIFEDIYVAMTGRPVHSASRPRNHATHGKAMELLKVERINDVSFHPRQEATIQPGSSPPPVRRKMPQPFREIPSGISLM